MPDRAATQGGGNEHAQPERRARDSGPDLPGRSPAGLLSYTRPGALDATQPIFLAAVAFGLATDYGIFLLSRIKEARDSGVSDSEAVAVGLERTGRIVTAAAVLFAVAIGAFATSKLVFIKELGLGVALAVLIDATIIRALLVPSLIELLGSRNWWAPKPLRRLHNRIGLREKEPGNADTAPVPGRRPTLTATCSEPSSSAKTSTYCSSSTTVQGDHQHGRSFRDLGGHY
jgi:hypothetical protein